MYTVAKQVPDFSDGVEVPIGFWTDESAETCELHPRGERSKGAIGSEYVVVFKPLRHIRLQNKETTKQRIESVI
jgi:hypothetical protein